MYVDGNLQMTLVEKKAGILYIAVLTKRFTHTRVVYIMYLVATKIHCDIATGGIITSIWEI